MTDLTPENSYQWPATPASAMLGRDAWNAVMGSLSARLVTLEAQRVTLEAVIDDLKMFGLDRLDVAIGGLLSEVESAIEGLQLQLGLVEANFAAIVEDGVTADLVVETADRRFWTPADDIVLSSKANAGDVSVALGDEALARLQLGENALRRSVFLGGR